MRAPSTPATPREGEHPPGRDTAREAPPEPLAAAPPSPAARLDPPVGSLHEVPRAPHVPDGVGRGYLPPFDGIWRDAVAVRRVLSDISVRGDLAATMLVAGEDRREVALLAETARALHGLLGDVRPGAPASPAPPGPAGGVPGGGERLPAALVRVARMERWLTARAHDDAAAQPAADLCLWVLEHCEP